MKTIQDIMAIYTPIERALFYTDGALDYAGITQATIDLANALHGFTGDDEDWIYTELPDFIVSAYWHYTEWHAGQDSDSYAALCALGQIFNPGMSTPPESVDGDEESEYAIYSVLNELAERSATA